jgi:hypothetical protein
MDTSEAQSLIRKFSEQLGWSQAKLARELYIELYDEDDDAEIARFMEKLKKQLNRSSTSVERLEAYINIIRMHPDFQNVDLVQGQQFATPDLLPNHVEKGMREISKKLTKKLEKKRNISLGE